jgi:hypothetical protein
LSSKIRSVIVALHRSVLLENGTARVVDKLNACFVRDAIRIGRKLGLSDEGVILALPAIVEDVRPFLTVMRPSINGDAERWAEISQDDLSHAFATFHGLPIAPERKTLVLAGPPVVLWKNNLGRWILSNEAEETLVVVEAGPVAGKARARVHPKANADEETRKIAGKALERLVAARGIEVLDNESLGFADGRFVEKLLAKRKRKTTV